MDDARRLGGIELRPDEASLGPDALTITRRQLASALGGVRAPIKAVLLDQHRVAGIGNLLADEVLWRAGIDPARAAGTLADDEVSRLHRTIRRVLPHSWPAAAATRATCRWPVSGARGAPRDGTPLERRTIGGRTTYSCPAHQR